MNAVAPIHLKPFALTPKEYLEVLIRLRTGKVGWLYALMPIAGLILLMGSGGNSFVQLLALVNLLYPFVILLLLYRFTRLKANRTVYETRSVYFDADGMTITTEGGAKSEVPWKYVTDRRELKRWYILYVTAGSFVFLDRSTFPDKDTETMFRTWSGMHSTT